MGGRRGNTLDFMTEDRDNAVEKFDEVDTDQADFAMDTDLVLALGDQYDF